MTINVRTKILEYICVEVHKLFTSSALNSKVDVALDFITVTN